MLPFISLEDHFASDAMRSSPNVHKFGFNLFPVQVQENMFSVGDRRIQDMDKGDVSLQVVSSIPAPEGLEICRRTNEQLYEAVLASNGRLAGFAMLPMADPAAAAAELERCVTKLGFLGALIPNHAGGQYYDGDAYRQFWKKAEELDIPIYLHPTPASPNQRPSFEGNYPPDVTTILSQQGWGWHADVALHFIKLYCSGLFNPDACPRLKLVIGHMGEMLPFMIQRIDTRLKHNWKSLDRPLLTVWAENLWITVSGMWDLAPFACLIRSTSMDRILYSVDWPFESNEEGREFMRKVEKSGLVTQEELEMIAYKNAERLLKVKASWMPSKL
jgi:predicted TIM-barrel fold metal-dependent hydrolase